MNGEKQATRCCRRHCSNEAYRRNMGDRSYTIQDLCNLECIKKLIRMARTPEHADSVKDIKAYRQIAESVK